jgi:hypothetical protein
VLRLCIVGHLINLLTIPYIKYWTNQILYIFLRCFYLIPLDQRNRGKLQIVIFLFQYFCPSAIASHLNIKSVTDYYL